jgi:hypothetical protein
MWRDAGFECDTPIKNTGAGAATMRIQALPNRAPIISDLLLALIFQAVAQRSGTCAQTKCKRHPRGAVKDQIDSNKEPDHPEP